MKSKKKKPDRTELVLFLAVIFAVGSLFWMVMRQHEKLLAMQETIAQLEERIGELDKQLADAVAAAPEASGKSLSMNELFTLAGMESKITAMKEEVENLRKTKGEEAMRQFADKQVSLWKGVYGVTGKMLVQNFDRQLAGTGFPKEEREKVASEYQKMLDQVTEIQIRWYKGELDRDETLQAMKERAIEFYDSVEYEYGKDKALKAVDIIFPTPELKKMFLSD